jgi:hypothetical protein
MNSRTENVKILISLALLLMALGGGSAFATTINATWTGAAIPGFDGSGNWATPANWAGGVVPNNSNGTTYNVTLPTIDSFHYQVAVDIITTIDNLIIGPNANLGVGPPGALTVTGNVYLTGAGSACTLPTYCGFLIGSPIQVSGTIYSTDGQIAALGTFTAANYVQSGAYSFGQIDRDSTANLASGSIDGGEFVLYDGSVWNGNLVINGGTLMAVNPSSINGNLAVSDTGTLATRASAPLSVSGNASLGGALDLTGLPSSLPALSSYVLMTYASETGQFSSVDVTGLNSYGKLVLDYGPTSLVAVVTVTVPTPEPSSIILLGSGLLGLTFAFQRKIHSGRRPAG